MHRYRVPIPRGHVAFTAQEAFNVARSFGTDYEPQRFFVKAQVKCEGRTSGYFKENGFIGGLHSVETLTQVREVSDKMLGKKYVSERMTQEGAIVHCVYIQEQLDIQQ